jgi:hypothetical protein
MITFSHPENAGCVELFTLVRLSAPDEVAMHGGGDGRCSKKFKLESQSEQGRSSKATELGRDRYQYLTFSGTERNGRCAIRQRQS